jgi:hypothetical protein
VQARSGPIDILVVGFDGPDFDPGIGPALRDLEALDGIRIVDLRFVSRGVDGRVESLGIEALRPQLDHDVARGRTGVAGGLLDADDAEEVGADLAPGTSAVVLAIEHAWTLPFEDAVRASGGAILDHARVPSAALDDVRRGAV